MSKEVESFKDKSPDLQYFGKDCHALAATVGGLASKKKIRIWTSKKKLEIWSLTKSDLSHIMAFLSDAAGQFLEWISRVDPGDGKISFEPR
jgi:hypothetical protein